MTTYVNTSAPKEVIVNKWVDFADRVGWTAVQALGAAIITVLSTDVDWKQGLIFVGIAVLLAIAKVTVAQNTGKDDLGSITRKPVIE